MGALPPNPQGFQGIRGSSGYPHTLKRRWGNHKASPDGYPSQPHPAIPSRVAPQRCPFLFHRTWIAIHLSVFPVKAFQTKQLFTCQWRKRIKPFECSSFPDFLFQRKYNNLLAYASIWHRNSVSLNRHTCQPLG